MARASPIRKACATAVPLRQEVHCDGRNHHGAQPYSAFQVASGVPPDDRQQEGNVRAINSAACSALPTSPLGSCAHRIREAMVNTNRRARSARREQRLSRPMKPTGGGQGQDSSGASGYRRPRMQAIDLPGRTSAARSAASTFANVDRRDTASPILARRDRQDVPA